MTAARTAAPALLAAILLAAGCGGETETVTVTETETETVTETVEDAPEGPDDRAYQLAEDICGALPRALVASFLGVNPNDSEALADEFAEIARPELSDAARDGCLAALENE